MKRNEKGQFVKGSHWRPEQPFRDKEWLQKHYIELEQSASEIAAMFGVTDGAIHFWLHKHGIPRRSISEARKVKHWGASGIDNPMWNRRGEKNPRWLGGVTPERQAFYTSEEWREACKFVWKRDNATCVRCGLQREDAGDMPFHIHHIKSFADKELRAEPSNLVLVCEVCHLFIHSKKNTTHEYLSQE